jgi:2-methylcitrate dehydratase
MQLHPRIKDRIGDISRITIRTHEAAIRIIDKKGPLNNYADRDHCIQYIVAVMLVFGRLTAADYEDAVACDPRIDALREKMICVEDAQFTRDYHDPEKRSIANGLMVEFKNGERLDEVVMEYPIGHRLRRKEGIPLLETKFEANLARVFPAERQKRIIDLCRDRERLETMPANDFVDMFVI